MEGSLDCIAEFPLLLGSKLRGDSLMLRSADDNRVLVWKGNPSNKTSFKEFRLRSDTIVSLKDHFGYYQGKIVVQLLDDKLLLDENIHYLEGGRPWLVSKVEPTVRATGVAPDMILVPGTEFTYEVGASEDFIPTPRSTALLSASTASLSTNILLQMPSIMSLFKALVTGLLIRQGI
jgi:hypothetical protein